MLGSYEDQLQDAVQRQAPALRVERLKVTFLAAPDKTDPLNLRALMVAEAVIDGRSCAWIAEGLNGEQSATGARLIKALAPMIVANPRQERTQANANVLKIDPPPERERL